MDILTSATAVLTSLFVATGAARLLLGFVLTVAFRRESQPRASC
jgi:hypothetical protein